MRRSDRRWLDVVARLVPSAPFRSFGIVTKEKTTKSTS